jgi:hypothetical protein
MKYLLNTNELSQKNMFRAVANASKIECLALP